MIEYYTMNEASEVTGIPLSVLADAIRSKQLAAVVHDADQSASIQKTALDEWLRKRGAEPTAVAGRWLNVDQAAELVGTTPYEVRLAVLHEKIPCRLERVAVYQWWEQAVRGTLDEVGDR